MRYRKPLLAGGIRLFELRARAAARKDMSLFGSRGASLHTKAFVVDGRYGFVGSFNFDPRSVSLNTEMGLLFEHAGLAQEMQAVFATETEANRTTPPRRRRSQPTRSPGRGSSPPSGSASARSRRA